MESSMHAPKAPAQHHHTKSSCGSECAARIDELIRTIQALEFRVRNLEATQSARMPIQRPAPAMALPFRAGPPRRRFPRFRHGRNGRKGIGNKSSGGKSGLNGNGNGNGSVNVNGNGVVTRTGPGVIEIGTKPKPKTNSTNNAISSVPAPPPPSSTATSFPSLPHPKPALPHSPPSSPPSPPALTVGGGSARPKDAIKPTAEQIKFVQTLHDREGLSGDTIVKKALERWPDLHKAHGKNQLVMVESFVDINTCRWAKRLV